MLSTLQIMSSLPRLSVFLLIILSTFANWLPASAEPVYSWKDKDGRTYYGSKPSATSHDVSPVKADNISRYSSDRVVRANKLEKESDIDESSIPLTTPQVDETSKDDNSVLAVTVQGQVVLKRTELKITTDDSGRITQCHVLVENTSEVDAADVRVSFTFPDGSVVPAFGAATIPAKGLQAYTIPDSLLPLQLGAHDKVLDDKSVSASIISASGEH